ncbi:hypothetical protein CEJ87_15240 [Caldifermentibacillus hisashii]|nr:hypothetical protein CEJ87_15240 [Caldifermentibacillus hisashii]
MDQSGSMKNLDSQAKGFALALMWIAKRQKRDFCYIPFSSSSEQHIFEKGKISIRDMTRFATNFLGGGTNFQNPLNRALGVINQSRFEKADVIFITDGDDHVGEEFIETFNEKMADLGSPEKRVLGRCVYRLNNKENPAETYAGYVTFDPYK